MIKHLVEEGGLLPRGRSILLYGRGVLLSKMVLYPLGGALAQQRGEKRFSCFVGTRLPFSLLARVNHYSTAYMSVIYHSYYFYYYELSLGFYLCTFRQGQSFFIAVALRNTCYNCINCVKLTPLPSQGFDLQITILFFLNFFRQYCC